MFALLIGFLAAGLVVLAAGRRLGSTAYAVAAAPFLATLVWLAVRRADVAAGLDESVSWVSELGLDLSLRIDGFAALMVVLVAGIGVLVFGYAGGTSRRRAHPAVCSGCSCCSAGRWSGSSCPTTCSSSTGSGS